MKGGDIRERACYVKSTGRRIKGREKAKQEISGIGQKVKQKDTSFFTSVGIVNDSHL